MRFKVIKSAVGMVIEIPNDFLSGAAGTGGGGGGGGEEIEPLSNTVWVDSGTTAPLAQQDGSIANPFSTVTAALAAIGSITRYTILMTPGDYSAETNIVLPATANISIGFVCLSTYYGLGAVTPELSATMPGFSGGNATQIIHFVNCIWNDRPVTPTGILRADWCRFLGTPGTATVTANSLSTNYSTFTQRISTTSTVSARNVDFLGTGAIITVAIAGGIVNAYLCRFDPAATISIVITGAGGEFRIDGVTNFHWKAATETLTGGTKVIQDDLAA